MPKSTMRLGLWSPTEDQFLRDHPDWPHKQIAAALGRTTAAVRNRVSTLGLAHRRMWTSEEVQSLRDAYAAAPGNAAIDLAALARQFDRSRSDVCSKARKLGLTNRSRTLPPSARERIGAQARERLREHGHPRGALGRG